MFNCVLKRAATSTPPVAAAAAAAAAASSTGVTADGATASEARPAVSPAARSALHSLYRRLLEAGEDGAMMQHTLSTHTLKESVQIGTRLLGYHTGLTTVDAQARSMSAWRHPIRRARLAVRRRRFAWRLFSTRLQLRSKNAISDALVYSLFVITCVLLYEIYRACRVGVTRAEERYRTMAIPIMQTFDALEAMEQRKRMLKREMEEDIIRQRAS